MRKDADAQSLKQAASTRLTPILMDLTDVAAVARAAQTVADAVGDAGIAGLVNNAGVGTFGPMEALPLDDLRHQLEANVVGQVAVIQAFLPMLRKARGRIINIGSVGGRTTIPFGGALCASKHAIEAINDAFRMELRPWGIAVCLVAPGAIRTTASEKMVDDGERIIARAMPDRMNLYLNPFLKMLREMMRDELAGSSPTVVAEVIAKALTDPKPQTRYPAGARSTMLSVLPQILPTRLFDWIKLRQVGLV